MTLSLTLSAPAPREPNRPSLRELLALFPVGDPERHQCMMDAAEVAQTADDLSQETD